MASKDIQTKVTVSVETKGFDKGQQAAAKLNQEAAKGLGNQAKGFKDAEKNSVQFVKSVADLRKQFAGSSAEMAKQIEGVVKGFDDFTNMDFSDVQRDVGKLTNRLKDLNKEQLSVTRELEGMEDKGGEAYKSLEEYLKGVNSAARRTSQSINTLKQAFAAQYEQAKRMEADAEKRRGAFRQGLMQGGFPMPAPFLQRGPGMGRQVAGMAVGMGARGLLGAGRGIAGGIGMGGVGGLTSMLSGVPIAGQFLAGQFGAAVGYSQQALAYQQSKLALTPYMQEEDLRKRSAAQVRLNALIAEREKLLEKQAAQESVGDKVVDALNFRARGAVSGAVASTVGDVARAIGGGAERARAAAPKGRRLQELEKLIDDARANLPPLGHEGVGELGAQLLGVSKTEAMQALGGILAAGGGTLPEAREQGIVAQGFAARTRFGIQEPVAGAFLAGGRRGGLMGAEGRAGAAFKEAIESGLRLGLRGSELQDYMQQMAGDIQQFTQTGIPVNKESLDVLATQIGGAGITGTRAMVMARGIQSYVQTMSTRGIQGGADLMMLRDIGQYRGGGAAEYQRATIRMEEVLSTVKGQGVEAIQTGGPIAAHLLKYMEAVGGGGETEQGRAAQDLALASRLRKMGVQISPKEAMFLGARLRGGRLAPGQEEAMLREQRFYEAGEAEAAGIEGREGMTKAATRAISTVAPGVRGQARVVNQQIAAGQTVLRTVQKLEKSAARTSSAFNRLAVKGIDPLISKFEEIGVKLAEYAGKGVAIGGSGLASGLDLIPGVE